MRTSRSGITSALASRTAICFSILFALFGGSTSIFALLPFLGSSLDTALRRPFDLLTQWVGIHFVHLTGVSATLHVQSGSDAALQWVSIPVMLALALTVGTIWALLDRGSANPNLIGWLRLFVRITLGIAMLRYAFIKIFPIQFPNPPLPVLNEPVGETSPTILFWSLYGTRPGFVMLLGWTELIAGLSLLFRRTALFGAVLTFIVMANVALLDTTFNVPVKLYSLLLLILALVLLTPDLKNILRFCFTAEPASATQTWSPRMCRPATRRLLLSVELLVAVLACWQFATGTYSVWRMKQDSVRTPPPFTGGWTIQKGGQGLVGPDGSQIVKIFFEANSDAYFRAANGMLWRSRAIYDRSHRLLRVLYQVRGMLMFAVEQSDADDLALKPLGPTGTGIAPLTLRRIHLPSQYPLLQDRMHWIAEFEPLH